MDWPLLLLIFFSVIVVLLMTGLPIAFVFMLVTTGGALTLWSGGPGMELVVLNMQTALSTFTLLAIVEFTLMGMVIFHSGMGTTMLRVLGDWLGSIPGRLSILGIAFATLFATMSGSSLASSTVMATVLTPEMEKQGYKKPMSLGPILGGGGLAMMIPPSGLAIILAAIAKISVAKILIGGAIPGLMLAALYMIYIVTRAWLQPDLAPPYTVERPPLPRRLYDTLLYVVPLGLIVFLTLGLIFLGVATPSQSAVTGALGAFILAGVYGKLDWNLVLVSLRGTVRVSTMILMIFASSATFSQIMGLRGHHPWAQRLRRRPRRGAHPHHHRHDGRGAHHGHDHGSGDHLHGHHPDLPAGGGGPGLRPGVVRAADAPQRRDGPDLAALRHEPLRRQGRGAARHHHARRLRLGVAVSRL